MLLIIGHPHRTQRSSYLRIIKFMNFIEFILQNLMKMLQFFLNPNFSLKKKKKYAAIKCI